jgi:hypothetical protein
MAVLAERRGAALSCGGGDGAVRAHRAIGGDPAVARSARERHGRAGSLGARHLRNRHGGLCACGIVSAPGEHRVRDLGSGCRRSRLRVPSARRCRQADASQRACRFARLRRRDRALVPGDRRGAGSARAPPHAHGMDRLLYSRRRHLALRRSACPATAVNRFSRVCSPVLSQRVVPPASGPRRAARSSGAAACDVGVASARILHDVRGRLRAGRGARRTGGRSGGGRRLDACARCVELWTAQRLFQLSLERGIGSRCDVCDRAGATFDCPPGTLVDFAQRAPVAGRRLPGRGPACVPRTRIRARLPSLAGERCRVDVLGPPPKARLPRYCGGQLHAVPGRLLHVDRFRAGARALPRQYAQPTGAYRIRGLVLGAAGKLRARHRSAGRHAAHIAGRAGHFRAPLSGLGVPGPSLRRLARHRRRACRARCRLRAGDDRGADPGAPRCHRAHAPAVCAALRGACDLDGGHAGEIARCARRATSVAGVAVGERRRVAAGLAADRRTGRVAEVRLGPAALRLYRQRRLAAGRDLHTASFQAGGRDCGGRSGSRMGRDRCCYPALIDDRRARLHLAAVHPRWAAPGSRAQALLRAEARGCRGERPGCVGQPARARRFLVCRGGPRWDRGRGQAAFGEREVAVYSTRPTRP